MAKMLLLNEEMKGGESRSDPVDFLTGKANVWVAKANRRRTLQYRHERRTLMVRNIHHKIMVGILALCVPIAATSVANGKPVSTVANQTPPHRHPRPELHPASQKTSQPRRFLPSFGSAHSLCAWAHMQRGKLQPVESASKSSSRRSKVEREQTATTGPGYTRPARERTRSGSSSTRPPVKSSP